MDRIQFISIGIKNPADTAASIPSVLNGEVWVDELRLLDVDNTPGWAYKVDVNVKLADIGTIAFSLSERNPYFHGLEDQFGTLNTTKAWSLSTSFAFEKLLPETWNGSVINFSYTHVESINNPLYLPGTDILVEKEAELVASNPTKLFKNADDVRNQSEDLSISDSYSLPTLKLNIPSTSWLITETVDKMTFGYNYTTSYQRNPSTEFANYMGLECKFQIRNEV